MSKNKRKYCACKNNVKRAVLKAIQAGNDIIMIGLPYKKIKAIIKYIIRKAQKGKIRIERINQSVEKIMQMKEKYNVNDKNVEGFSIEEINKKIKQVNG